MKHSPFAPLLIVIAIGIATSVVASEHASAQGSEEQRGDAKKEAPKKGSKTVDPSGTWRLEYDFNGTHVKDAFRITLGKDGKVGGILHRNNRTRPLKNAKLKGNMLSFSTSSMREGNEWITTFNGRIKGDSMEGTAVLKGEGQSYDFVWKPKRSVEMEDVAGVWNILITTNDREFKPTLTISKNGKKYQATYARAEGQKLPVTVFKVKDNNLVFTVATEINGNKIKIDFKGRPYGNKITGTLDYDLADNTGQTEFSAVRKVAKAKKEEAKKKSTKKDSTQSDKSKEKKSSEAKAVSSVIGRRVPNFVLPNLKGERVALGDYGDAKVVVLVFMGTACPIGNAYVPDLNALHERYRDRSVQVIGINANLSDSAKTIAEHAKEYKISFPVLIDQQQVAADMVSARRTPEAFVLDHRRQIKYRGRIDDRVGFDFKREKARRSDLEEAVKEVLADKPVSSAENEPQGCLITRRASLREKGRTTFAKHASRILHKRCANCHHEGTAAPFSLLTYEDARNWSQMIKEVVVTRRMPPWNADPRYSKFSNDHRMPKEEIDTLVAWIDEGAPFGDKKNLPKPPRFAKGWTIGKPDVVFRMPQEYTVKASGTVEYQYFVTPTNFKEDVWVKASEPRPGNRSVVHHIIVFVRPKGVRRRRGLSAVGGFAPGEEPVVWPQGIGYRIPAGAELVWQVHYTPTGKVEKDRSEVGLILYKKPPQRRARGGGVINGSFAIPAGNGHYRVYKEKRFDRDVELLALMPHMHLRGKDFRYTARYPDGKKKILLNVPSYDFNWQHRYRFAKPIRLPKGTTLECVAHFDNSVNNPANPDPTKIVRWGDQTWEEMMIGWYSYVDASK